MARSYSELMGLEFEAERLVRSGESRAEVSRRLGVHPQTLAGWALRGGWRKKDLDMERNKAITRATILTIRAGNRAAEAEQQLRARMVDFMREAVRLLAEGDEAALGELERRLAWVENFHRLEGLKVEVEADPKVAGSRSLGEADVGDADVEHLK